MLIKKLSKLTIVMVVATNLNATSLKEVLNSVINNNDLIQSSKFLTKSKERELQSVSNIYSPTLTIGDTFSRLDVDKSAKQVGSTNIAYIKAGVNLYDGGRNKAIKKQKFYQYQSNQYQQKLTTKNLLLQATTLFFQAKSIQAQLKAYEDKGKTLKAQYEKEKIKYKNQMVTIDNLLKLQSEYQANLYQISDLKYQFDVLLQNLSLLTNQNITTLDDDRLLDIKNLKFKESDNIKSLKNDIKASKENINILKSAKKVKVKLEDSYNFYQYDDYNQKILSDLPDSQNQLMLSIQFNLYDTTTRHKTQSAILAKKALDKKLAYQLKQEKLNFLLDKRLLKTQKDKIESAKLALKMAQSVYEIISDKYENGVVDNITYLDALSKKVTNEAMYEQALYEYEIAKAKYYFDSGVDYGEILK